MARTSPATTSHSTIQGPCCEAEAGDRPAETSSRAEGFGRAVFVLLGVVFAAVLLAVTVGEWSGLLDELAERVPAAVWLSVILVAGYPVFRPVLRAALHGRITAHTLMTVGVAAAAAVGAWPAAVLVVFFMRVAEGIEGFTMRRARGALRDLTAMAPQVAAVDRGGQEVSLPVEAVRPGDVVVVRPGGRVPVDGEVVSGHATVDQAAITGESMPAEAEPGTAVFAASLVRLGVLRVRATRVGADTTFGRVVRLVEEAEGSKGEVQRAADRFATWYLPFVLAFAGAAFLVGRDVLASAAVLVVACSCAFAIATPVAVLASVGRAAKGGLVVKGGRYLEALARADVLLLDKTGTLTSGRPRITDVLPLNGAGPDEVLALAASAERWSEHPLAEAVRALARDRAVAVPEPEAFRAAPGEGVEARIGGALVRVGRRPPEGAGDPPSAAALEADGKTLLWLTREGELLGVLAATDTLRPDVPEAIAALDALGFRHVELLTGDHERAAAALAAPLGIAWRAGLLPEDKIAVVKDYQARGHTVVMVGDGVNDAPALAQADVGVAMGGAGTDVAMEAAHVVLMGDDWRAVPELFRTARRTMSVVHTNLALAAAYNLAGLSLAAAGLLPLVWAAAAQALPDLGIMANSARLLRPERPTSRSRTAATPSRALPPGWPAQGARSLPRTPPPAGPGPRGAA